MCAEWAWALEWIPAGDEKRESDPPKLELQAAVSHHMGAANKTSILPNNSLSALNCWAVFPGQPQFLGYDGKMSKFHYSELALPPGKSNAGTGLSTGSVMRRADVRSWFKAAWQRTLDCTGSSAWQRSHNWCFTERAHAQVPTCVISLKAPLLLLSLQTS